METREVELVPDRLGRVSGAPLGVMQDLVEQSIVTSVSVHDRRDVSMVGAGALLVHETEHIVQPATVIGEGLLVAGG